MPINPIRIASEIEARFRRYLETTFSFPHSHSDLREQFRAGLAEPGRLLRGPYGLLALGPGGQPGHRSAGFHWGEPRVTAFDAETHLRPLWFNRTTTRLARAGGEADAWFAAHAEPIPPESLFQTLPGCTVHPFTKGQPVHFGPVFAGLTGHRIVRCQVQDPYLLTAHQMEALTAFVKAVPWGAGGPIAVRLTTHMTENDPTKRFQLSPDDQRRQLETRLGAIPGAKPEIKFRSSKYDPLHMRYAYFQLEDGERLYVLERGLDVADPRGGRARDDSYILEFASFPDTLADVLKLPNTPTTRCRSSSNRTKISIRRPAGVRYSTVVRQVSDGGNATKNGGTVCVRPRCWATTHVSHSRSPRSPSPCGYVASKTLAKMRDHAGSRSTSPNSAKKLNSGLRR